MFAESSRSDLYLQWKNQREKKARRHPMNDGSHSAEVYDSEQWVWWFRSSS